MLRKSEKILMSLNFKAKPTLPTGNCRTLPQWDRETAKKRQKRIWVWSVVCL